MPPTPERRDALSQSENSLEPSAFAFARVAPCRVGLPQEGTPSFRAGRKQKCHCARGLLNSFEAAGPIARPSYRM